MKRQLLALVTVVVAWFASVNLAHAETYEFKADVDYTVLKAPIKAAEAKGPYLLEYFWLGCPHCRAMNPMVKQFESANPKVSVVRRPGLGNDRWVFDAHVYYALQAMGKSSLVYDLMDYYHQLASEEQRLPDLADVKAYMTKQGIDAQKFEKAMDDDATLDKLSVAYRDQQALGLKGVPVFIVNGKYQLRFDGFAGVKEPAARFTALVEYLLKQK
ncbi:thiol:disulfide interchange protein DsbA/DsbL [Shewanella sp. A3A]|nr:thiol:disulfide interchange protein DsbA/DsbL [Shewanella ferrihydritica]